DEFIDSDIELKAFISGERYNMVPESAEAKLKVLTKMSAIIQAFEGFLRKSGNRGKYEIDGGFLKLELEGQSAHGSTPEEGLIDGTELLKFLSEVELDQNGKKYIVFAYKYMVGNLNGEAFNMNYQREDM